MQDRRRIDSDYKHYAGILYDRISANLEKFPESLNYDDISNNNVGYGKSSYEEQEDLINSGKTYEFNPLSTFDTMIGLPVDNPKHTLAEIDSEFRELKSDKNQNRAYIYGLNPDQIQRKEISKPNNFQQIIDKGQSGLSSDAINRELLLMPYRGRQIIEKNREIYKDFI